MNAKEKIESAMWSSFVGVCMLSSYSRTSVQEILQYDRDERSRVPALSGNSLASTNLNSGLSEGNGIMHTSKDIAWKASVMYFFKVRFEISSSCFKVNAKNKRSVSLRGERPGQLATFR